MPRVSEIFHGSAVHLFHSIEDANNPHPDDFHRDDSGAITYEQRCKPKVRGASGCVAAVFTQQSPHMYIVTARHVITNGKCFLPKVYWEGGDSKIIECCADDWILDSENDLAALPLKERIAVHPIIKEMCPTAYIEATLDIGIGDEVFMVGRFWGQPHAPVTRFGSIAAWPERNIPRGSGAVPALQSSYLVEMRSHNGFSGAPVFLYINPRSVRPWIFHDDGEPERLAETEDLHFHFLGINWGHLGNDVAAYSAMACVVPWRKVWDFLESNSDLVELRHSRDRQDALSSEVSMNDA